MHSTSIITVCSSCGNNHMITDRESAEVVCSRCGRVISDYVETNSPDWHTSIKDRSNNRSGIGMSLSSLARHDMGLSTIIGRTDRDASGNILDAAMRSRMQRLRTWDIRSQAHSSAAKNRKHAFTQLSILKDKLNLSDAVIEKTAYIYRKAMGLAASVLYLSSLSNDEKITQADLAKAAGVTEVTLRKGAKDLRKELSKSIRN